MNIIERLRPWWGRKVVRGFVVVAIVLIILLVQLFSRTAPPAEISAPGPTIPAVTRISAQAYAGTAELSLIGTARAFTEAQITAERSGRVVAVNVSLGQSVAAGQIVALLESASERAAVTQAEGVYEAAQAATAQSSVGVDEANNALVNTQNVAITTVRNAFTTVQGAVVNNMDQFFSDPNRLVPGLRINGRGYSNFLNNERVVYQTLLPEWQAETKALTSENLTTAIADAEIRVTRTLTMVDTFIEIFNGQSSGGSYDEIELQTYSTNFTTLRNSLVATISSLEQARSSLQSAEDGVRRATISATGGTTSVADAQVKQALGALQAAQANLAKSVLRSPISGTVNALTIRTGDFVNSFTAVATVANNDALEIVTYVGDSERSVIAIDDEVTINDTVAGTVVAISPALDPVTRKTEVRIATESGLIANGDTVRITKQQTKDVSSADVPMMLPLTAVRFASTDGSVFVVEDGRLVSVPVTFGEVRGAAVEITSGIDATTLVLVDARGKAVGDEVTISE